MGGANNYTESDPTLNSFSWLNARVKGIGLVTKTSDDGDVGERKIIETADVANYGTGTAIQQQIQEISIPTMGAVMAAISNNQVILPTGTANTVVMYNNSGAIGGSRGIYDGSTTYNSSTDANKLVTAGVARDVANYEANNNPQTSVTYKTCTRWVDGQSHTDANCLLWSLEEKPIYAKECHSDSDCANLPGSPYGCATPYCDNGECLCYNY